MVSVTLEDWTEEKCLQLIKEYRKRPLLWDPKDASFYNKTYKPAAWTEIGQIFNISPEVCKRKMITLLSSFRREKSKFLNSLNFQDKDNSEVYRSHWFAFNQLTFLMDKASERKRQAMGIFDDEITIEEEPTTSDAPDQSKTETDIIPKIRVYKRKKLIGREEDVSVRKQKIQDIGSPKYKVPIASRAIPESTSSQNPNDDEIHYFANFITSKMKKYSETTKNKVQREICDIIFKADQNLYEKNMKYAMVYEDPLGTVEILKSECISDDDVADIEFT